MTSLVEQDFEAYRRQNEIAQQLQAEVERLVKAECVSPIELEQVMDLVDRAREEYRELLLATEKEWILEGGRKFLQDQELIVLTALDVSARESASNPYSFLQKVLLFQGTTFRDDTRREARWIRRRKTELWANATDDELMTYVEHLNSQNLGDYQRDPGEIIDYVHRQRQEAQKTLERGGW